MLLKQERWRTPTPSPLRSRPKVISSNPLVTPSAPLVKGPRLAGAAAEAIDQVRAGLRPGCHWRRRDHHWGQTPRPADLVKPAPWAKTPRRRPVMLSKSSTESLPRLRREELGVAVAIEVGAEADALRIGDQAGKVAQQRSRSGVELLDLVAGEVVMFSAAGRRRGRWSQPVAVLRRTRRNVQIVSLVAGIDATGALKGQALGQGDAAGVEDGARCRLVVKVGGLAGALVGLGDPGAGYCRSLSRSTRCAARGQPRLMSRLEEKKIIPELTSE